MELLSKKLKKYVFEKRKGVETIKGVKFVKNFGTRIVSLPILIFENRLPILTTKISQLKKISEISLSKVITKIYLPKIYYLKF